MTWTQADLDAHQNRHQKRRQASQAPGPATITPPAKASPVSRLDVFYALLVAHRLPLPEREYRFLPDRQLRADYAWPAQKVIVERMGGVWAKEGSRAKRAHAMPLKILRDYEKSNLAQMAGFRYLQYTPEQLDSGAALETLRILLAR